MVLPDGRKGWGDPGTELVRVLIGPDGRTRPTELVRPPDPAMAHWLPSIERWCWHAPAPQPALLFTSGTNASMNASTNRNSLNTEVWLQVPQP
jgi:hypothetical protein